MGIILAGWETTRPAFSLPSLRRWFVGGGPLVVDCSRFAACSTSLVSAMVNSSMSRSVAGSSQKLSSQKPESSSQDYRV